MIVASVGNVLVWAVWIFAAFACLASGAAVGGVILGAHSREERPS